MANADRETELKLTPRQRIGLETCMRSVEDAERDLASSKLRLKEARSELERLCRKVGTIVTFDSNVVAIRVVRKGPMLPGFEDDPEDSE